VKDKCGVVGVRFDPEKNRDAAALYIYYALQALQHRGQESSGISVTDGKSVLSDKGMGLVTDHFNRERLQKLSGYSGIGHVRYSTTGSSKLENCQPFTVSYKNGTIAIAHNGNLINYKELKQELEAHGRVFKIGRASCRERV
jgi:amidophosphoribosyltransferase